MRRGLATGILVGALGAACAHPPPAVPRARPGRTVAIYVPDEAPDPSLTAAVLTIRARIAQEGGTPPPPARPSGDAIAYVDDRRWIELAPDADLTLTDLPPSADLDSLVVEPIGEPVGPDALAVVQCTRAPTLHDALTDLGHAHALVGRTVEARLAGGGTARGAVTSVDDGGLWLDDGGRAVRVDAARVVGLRVAGETGAVRCAVRGAPGRHLVRVAYVAGGVAWRAVHRIDAELDAGAGAGAGVGTATVRTGFQIDAAGWAGDADVTLWRGVPGGGDPPERVWAGRADLATAVTVWREPRRVKARTIDVFRGAVTTGPEAATDPSWRQASTSEVRAWLVVDVALPAGEALASITTSGSTPGSTPGTAAGQPGPPRMARGQLEPDGASSRMVLWSDPELRGFRVKTYGSGDDHGLREHLGFSVANLSGGAREVRVEEELRPARHEELQNARPAASIERGWLRIPLTVPPGGLARAACDVVYDL